MTTGAVTNHLDVAQITLYAFWIFFGALILYLRREDKREGYPLESDRSARAGRVKIQGFPAVPPPKTFRLADGTSVTVPNTQNDRRSVRAEPTGPWPGAPLEPVGNPMADGVGPAAWADRLEQPDLTIDGQPKLVPMRVANDFSVMKKRHDPRGLSVRGADGAVAGTVRDLWVDRAEPQVRYLEVEIAGARRVLLPITLARIDGYRRTVEVQSILARQFAGVPALANPDRVTRREEDKITAYYAGGKLYAEPSRQEPLL
jgi:photosynthetic reaction center H subunit